MAGAVETTELPDGSSEETVCEPLNHPLRVRILEVANTRPISPNQFIDDELLPPGISFPSKKAAMGNVSYHFRALLKYGCIELIDTRQVRGATEHIYRGITPVFFTSEEFDKLPIERRRMLSRTSFQGLIARADGAMRADIFDARTDRWFGWEPLELDEKGWKTITGLMDKFLPLIERANGEAKARLTESESDPIYATFGGMLFESPPPPPEPT
jgi:hypothetical protein